MFERLKDLKGVGCSRVTADSLICPEPCFLVSVSMVASPAGAATAIIRDGHNTDAEAVIDLAAIASYNDTRHYAYPIFFKRGLYVDVGLNVTSVLVQFSPHPKKL